MTLKLIADQTDLLRATGERIIISPEAATEFLRSDGIKFFEGDEVVQKIKWQKKQG